MNFLTTFIRLLIVVLLLGGTVFFGGREIWLLLAGEQIISDAHTLTRPTQWEKYLEGCSSSLITGSSPFAGFQLRFVDQEKYVLEVDCVAQQPVVKESISLLQGVKKTKGSAGFYYDFQSKEFLGEVQIEFLGRSRVVYVDGENVKQTWGTTQYIVSKPASACQAFGYTCCDAENQQGVGEEISAGVVDCSQNCFSSCLQRPLLLSFQSDPAGDYQERIVRLNGTSALVIFSFAFDESAAAIDTVTLDYGDGTQQSYEQASSLSPKEYSCLSGKCTFVATIQATDNRGVSSPTTRLSTITVELNADLTSSF